jgi:hypothetical protein
MNKKIHWEIVFLFGMNNEKVSFQVCDASQAGKVEDHLKHWYGINVFARTKTKVCLTYNCTPEMGSCLESKTIAALSESLMILRILDEPGLIIHKEAAARMAEALLLSEGMSFAKIKLKTPTFKDLANR